MKKALILTTTSGFLSQFELNNVRLLQEKGYQVHYATNFGVPIYEVKDQTLRDMGIILHHISIEKSPLSIKKNIWAYRELKRIIDREQIDVVHILYDFLRNVSEENHMRPVAGRMFCMDKPTVQYTAAENWNGGNISHYEFMRDISTNNYSPGKVIYDSGADYGGWWFCCFPMEFVQTNDVIPFFIHCDDVEYGLRCKQKPIIIEGVQVWHETYDKRITPLIQYYDTRNPLFVNLLYGLLPPADILYEEWKNRITDYHIKQDWLSEYYVIRGMNDFLKGLKWLKRIDSEKYHKTLSAAKSCKLKNAIFWRATTVKYILKNRTFVRKKIE